MLARRSAFALLTLGLTLGFLGLTAIPAHATVMVEIPIEQLVFDADAIVHASVARTGTQLETFDGHLEPHTIAELRVLGWIKGSGAEQLAIDELGGTVNGSGSWIDGTPRYREGEEVIVFLRRLPSGAYRTVGMEQGRFCIVHTVALTGGERVGRTLVERDTSTLAFAAWVDGQMQVRDGGRSPSVEYDTFVGFLASVLEQLAVSTPPTEPSDPRTTAGVR